MVIGQMSIAQTTYNMSDANVDDCEGILVHSMAGEEGNYDHNENFTFVICIPGATEIILAFDYFATEQNYDIMTIYDGPNRFSPVIATLSGVLQPPPTFIATSGCVTIHFSSDDNITANGWRIRWSTQITIPPTPTLTVVSMLECPLNEAVFQFSNPIGCDQIVSSNFTLLGPGGSSISSIVVLNCNNGLATRFRVVFNPPLGSPASYRLLFNGVIIDACGREHPVSTNVLFQISNCPISVYIQLPNGQACVGLCAQMEAVATGDNPQNFTYLWSPGGANTRIISVCSTIPIIYNVTVTDPTSGRTAAATFNYVPLENPIILNPIQDTVCASAGNRTLLTNMPGGNYYSGSIPDHHRQTGVYEFWRWSNGAVMRVDTVTYVAPNGCRVRDTVHILPINQGSVQASCLNAPDFQMNGGTPAGGFWSGPHLSPDGTFSPVENGAFWATYNAPNGCTARKRVHVYDSIIMPVKDTLCTTEVFLLEAIPPGGRWSGPGIVNNITGRLEAWRPTPNQWHTYTYTANGCVKTMQIYINELWAGPDIGLCASDTILNLPYIGDWSGPGTYDVVTNTFDISALGPGEYTYRLRQSICQDEFILYLVDPYINAKSNLNFCLVDQGFNLADYLDWWPGGGTMTGNGVTFDGTNWYFNPIVPGSGTHKIYYQWLNCLDSIELSVEVPSSFPIFEFCERSIPIMLTANPAGGTWSGPGFLDEQTGLFDPQIPGLGRHSITYTAPSGCQTTTEVDISAYEQVSISGVQQQYCYQNQLFPIIISPAGGRFTINGVVSNPEINPAVLGTGTHELYYTKGTGACSSFERRFIQILPPIRKVESSEFDSICNGQRTTISYNASGGSGVLNYNWDNNLGFGNSHIVSPLQNTWFRITVSDQCSDPLIDSVFIKVFSPFNIQTIEGPEVCFGEKTFAEITLNKNTYEVTWLTNPPIKSFRLDGLPGIYGVEIVELASGCILHANVTLPGAQPIAANFNIIPNQPCIDIIDNDIELIDLAFGYTQGWVDFGDGSSKFDMSSTGIIRHQYRDTGTYTIRQEVYNALGCVSIFEKQLCVRNMVRIFAPDVFTPNEDDRNDVYRFYAFGIKNANWQIYNRYGALIFTSNSLEDYWDGTYKGKPLNPDAFILVLEYEDQETGEKGIIKKELLLMK
jgi:gliding motility-associated-like protein